MPEELSKLLSELDDVLKVVSTTSDKLDSIDIVYGQLIFSRDNRAIYFDTDVRTSYQAIIPIQNDELRKKLVSPVNGFYFVIDTGSIWRYDKEQLVTKWFQVTAPPKDYIIYDEKKNFPAVGVSDALYVDRDVIYRFIDGEYVEMNSLKWGEF